MNTVSPTAAPKNTKDSPSRARVAAVAVAVVTTSLLWFAAQILDIDLTVDQHNGQPPMTIGLTMVAGSTLIVAVLGWGLLAVLERFLRRARTIWTVLAGVVLALSFGPILTVEATAGTKAVLSLMHFAVAAVLVPALRR